MNLKSLFKTENMAKVRRTFGDAKNKVLYLYHQCAKKAGCLSPESRRERRKRAKTLVGMIKKNSSVLTQGEKKMRSLLSKALKKSATQSAATSPMKTRSKNKKKKKGKKN